MVAAEDRALDLEQVLRVAHVLEHLRRHVLDRLDDAREGVHPREQHGVARIPGVQRDGAVVGVDDGLHRVAHVVRLVARDEPGGHGARADGVARRLVEAHPAAVRVLVRQRVAVDDPLDAAVGHDGVRVLVEREPRRDLLDARQRIAIPHDPGLRVDEVAQQDVAVLELRGEEDPPEQRSHGHAAGALVGVGRLAGGAGVVGEVELDRGRALRGADDGVRRAELAEVHARLLGVELTGRRDVALEEGGLAVAVRGVVVGRHEAEAVRVDEPVVRPVALALGDTGEVDLADGDHGTALGVVERVAVDVELGVERVVAADLLQLVVGRRDHGRVEQADVVQRARARGEHRL